jgi:hypothetical protein
VNEEDFFEELRKMEEDSPPAGASRIQTDDPFLQELLRKNENKYSIPTCQVDTSRFIKRIPKVVRLWLFRLGNHKHRAFGLFLAAVVFDADFLVN